MERSILLILLFFYLGFTNAKLYLDPNVSPLDTDLYQRVLDPEQCHRQLKYLRQNNTFVMAQFLDAGFKIPKGILRGNFIDYGNYHQCLGINHSEYNMTIQGKFCMIRVPGDQNIGSGPFSQSLIDFSPSFLQLPLKAIQKLEERKLLNEQRSISFADDVVNSRTDPNIIQFIQFRLAICVPKACTTKEVLESGLINITALGFKYEDEYCRLPNDRPWASVDYIAVVIFSLLGFLTLFSTSHDIYHNFICKKDPNNTSVILNTFSVYTNCKRLIEIKSIPGSIECLDGIRTISTVWVIFGHIFMSINLFPNNLLDLLEWAQSYKSVWVHNGVFAVDSFFVLSGLLLVYTTARKLTGYQLIRNLPIFYLHRLLRMFPVLAAMILFEASLYNRLGDGPSWAQVLFSVQKCRTFWWTTLLHLQNYVTPETCLAVTWYLAIDVHLHILSPIVLFWVLGRGKRMAWSALSIFLIMGLTVSTAYIFLIRFSTIEPLTNLESNMLVRAPAFLIGMFYGYAIHLTREKKIKMSPLLSTFFTGLSIVLLVFVMFCKFEHTIRYSENEIVSYVFESFLRPAWALGLGWIIFACVTGYGGPINWFLSLNIWKIPSRISYAVYLIHTSLIVAYYSNATKPIEFAFWQVMFEAMAFITITMVVSFFVTVLIDAPFAILCKLLLGIATMGKFNVNSNKTALEISGNVENTHLTQAQITNNGPKEEENKSENNNENKKMP